MNVSLKDSSFLTQSYSLLFHVGLEWHCTIRLQNKHLLQCLKQVLGCEAVYNLFSKNQYSELPLDDLLAVDNIQTVDGLGYTLATQVMVFDV